MLYREVLSRGRRAHAAASLPVLLAQNLCGAHRTIGYRYSLLLTLARLALSRLLTVKAGPEHAR